MTLIIKRKPRQLDSDQADRLTRIIRKEAFEAQSTAREIVESAQANANQVINDAKARQDQIIRASFDKGYRDGLAMWLRAIEDYRSREQDRLKELEPQLVKLAIQIAGKIIGREIQADPDLFESMTLKALRSMPRGTDISIRVHPDNVERTEKMLAARPFKVRVEVIPDDSLGAGDYRLESEAGSIDGRLEIALETIKEALVGRSEK